VLIFGWLQRISFKLDNFGFSHRKFAVSVLIFISLIWNLIIMNKIKEIKAQLKSCMNISEVYLKLNKYRETLTLMQVEQQPLFAIK
jgi:hypothetical protein